MCGDAVVVRCACAWHPIGCCSIGCIVECSVNLVAEARGLVGSSVLPRGRVIATTDDARCSSMRLSGDRRQFRNVSRFFGATNAEDWRLPLISLGGKLLEFCDFGRDATRERDVLENRVMFCNCHVDWKLVSGYREKRSGYIPVVLETFSCTLSFWAVIFLR